MAIPYSKSECAIVTSPDGWIVDATGGNGRYVASFYPAGLSQEEAFHTEGFIYLVFSHKDKEYPDLPDLLNKQKSVRKIIIGHLKSNTSTQSNVKIAM